MSEVQNLEQQRSNAKQLIDQREAVLRLANNPDFKNIVMEKFCVQECARYAHASADPAIAKEGREDAMAMAQASGHLRRFLSVVITMGNNAENSMKDLDEALANARAEEAGVPGGEAA